MMKKFLTIGFLALVFLMGACSQVPLPAEEELRAEFWLNRTYVDKDATGLNTGTNWVNAFNDLQDALDCVRATTCPAPIWVAGGVYYPDEGSGVTNNDATEAFYLIEGVNMYGGFDGIGAGGVGGAREWLLFQRDYNLYKTVLSGDIEQNDADANGDGIIEQPSDIVGTNSQHVVYVDAVGLSTTFTGSTVLDGFRVTAGSNGAPGGSGLLCNGSEDYTCSPTLNNLVFRGNEAAIGGAVANYYSSSTYTHVAFLGNEAQSVPGFGGAMYNYSSNLVMTDMQFTDNSAEYGGAVYDNLSNVSVTASIFEFNTSDWHGAGLFNDASSPLLTDVAFVDNDAAALGGGIFNLNSGPTLLDVGFYGNEASGGGAIANEINGGLAAGVSLPMTLTNTVFSGNVATDDGGAIYNWPNGSGGTLAMDMINATFSRNDAADEGGSIYTVPNNYAGFVDLTLINSIMWNSTNALGFNEICLGSGQVTISYSDVRAILAAGVTANCDGGVSTFVNNGNNLSQTPQFVDFDGPDALLGTLDDNLDLQATSPVIDEGDNAAGTQPLDFLNRTRVVDGDANGTATIDMGAYEHP
jgi:hypothetical protein